MTTIDLSKVKFNFDREKDKNLPEDMRVAANYIGYAVVNGYKEGLKADQRRIYATIQQKLEDGITKNKGIVELNDFELLFIKSGFQKFACPPAESANMVKVEDLFEKSVETTDEKKS